MRRRDIIMGGAALAAMLAAPALAQQQPEHPLWPLWERWHGAHLDFSGRVVDGPQDAASHSEGQGYGMLLAAEMGDEAHFRRMLDWTETNLAIRGSDSLLAWRWLPDLPARVPDLNNASDGDLFYAWALVRAAERFGVPAWRDRAAESAADLVRTCLADRPDRPGARVLLPAAFGFSSAAGLVLNPSYMMPLALRSVAAATDQPALAGAAEAGLALMREVAAARLVPDWLLLSSSGPGPAPGFSADAGFEAIRLPLFLAWSGETGHPALRRAAQAMAQAPSGQAATVLDPETGGIVSLGPEPGYRAVAALADCATRAAHGAAIPPFATQPYYPATLHLFTFIAQRERFPACIPL